MKSLLLAFCIAIAAACSACRQVVVRVEGLPENTPANTPLYISGDFNHWNPADAAARLKKGRSGRYYVTLPAGMGRTAYKFTRGDWTTVEADPCGHPLENRLADYLTSDDTVRIRIESWKDLGPTHCNRVVFRLKALPSETPPQDFIYMASNYNLWKANSLEYKFTKTTKGEYLLAVEPRQEELEFKITRGSWQAEATDADGNITGNFNVRLGNKDTINLSVTSWKDIDGGLLPGPRKFIVHTPSNTPPADSIFISGNFNNWAPADPRFMLKSIGHNLHAITINKNQGELLFKFTRGSWAKEEYDTYGSRVDNRRLRAGVGKVLCTIGAWRDLDNQQSSDTGPKDVIDPTLGPDATAKTPPLEIEAQVYVTRPQKTATKSSRIVFNGRGPRVLSYGAAQLITVYLLDKPPFNRTVYLRLDLPSANNKQLFISDKPGKNKLPYRIPVGTVIYACNKDDWNKSTQKVRRIGMITPKDQNLKFSAEELQYSQPLIRSGN